MRVFCIILNLAIGRKTAKVLTAKSRRCCISMFKVCKERNVSVRQMMTQYLFIGNSVSARDCIVVIILNVIQKLTPVTIVSSKFVKLWNRKAASHKW